MSRTKSPTTKRIDRVRHKLERAITNAENQGIDVVSGAFYESGCVCPIGAYLATTRDLDAARNFSATYARAYRPRSTALLQRLAKKLDYDLTGIELSFLVRGVDAPRASVADVAEGVRVTPAHEAFFRLGQRIALKHNLQNV